MGQKSELTRDAVEAAVARHFLQKGFGIFGVELAEMFNTTRATVENFIVREVENTICWLWAKNPNTSSKRERLSKCYEPSTKLLRDSMLHSHGKVLLVGDVGYYDAERNILTIDGVEMTPYFLFDLVNSKGEAWCKFKRNGNTVEIQTTSAENPSSLQDVATEVALKPVAGTAPRTPIQSIVEGNNKVTVVLDADGFMWRMHFDEAGNHHYHLL